MERTNGANDHDLALVLGGGGARAAYQAGVLKELARLRPELGTGIFTGVSAGAINATQLANHEGTFARAVDHVVGLWESITTEQVFEVGSLALAASAVRWGARLVSGGARLGPPIRGLVDTAPLSSFLQRTLGSARELHGIQRNLAAGRLRAVGVTTTDYGTGRSVTWFQGDGVEEWSRPHRRGIRTTLGIDHVMASAALPLFFPAVQVAGAWHGDGGVRLTAPLAPALHLGARAILAISTREGGGPAAQELPPRDGYPPPAQILSILMNAVFLDNLDLDAMQMERLNRLLERLPERERGGLRPIRILVLRPSQPLGRMAASFEPRLPGALRFMTRGLGTREAGNQDALSMLMFQHDYLASLLALGERDARSRAAEIVSFLDGGDPAG